MLRQSPQIDMYDYVDGVDCMYYDALIASPCKGCLLQIEMEKIDAQSDLELPMHENPVCNSCGWRGMGENFWTQDQIKDELSKGVLSKFHAKTCKFPGCPNVVTLYNRTGYCNMCNAVVRYRIIAWEKHSPGIECPEHIKHDRGKMKRLTFNHKT